MRQLDIVIPVYNESLDLVQRTISEIRDACSSKPNLKFQIIIVNDGSDADFGLSELASSKNITFLQHDKNQGYGQALKTGILAGSAPSIAILDADGTYPASDLPKLIEHIDNHDMVLGVRTGEVREIPLLRRFPKLMLNKFASYMAGKEIVDLNTGMRVFSRRLAFYLWGLYPSGFSFTSTLTMGATLGGFRVKEVPINYFKRAGSSSIHPIKDTIRFFRLVSRLGLLFSPKKLFTPIALLFVLAGLIKGLGVDYVGQGYIGNLAMIFILSGVQIFMMGLVAQLVVLSRSINLDHQSIPNVGANKINRVQGETDITDSPQQSREAVQ